jgi:hypothetical protein
MPIDNRLWHHIVVTTYGAWVRGDPRGFRTRHHREHVDGDYKSPPPVGYYANEEAYSRRHLKQGVVSIPRELRSVIGTAIRMRLTELGAMPICVAVAAQHAHMLAKLPLGMAREWTGFAKRHAWFVARDHGWRGKLWAVRSHAKLVRTRSHQLATFRYIVRHRDEGAWIWRIDRPER